MLVQSLPATQLKEGPTVPCQLGSGSCSQHPAPEYLPDAA